MIERLTSPKSEKERFLLYNKQKNTKNNFFVTSRNGFSMKIAETYQQIPDQNL